MKCWILKMGKFWIGIYMLLLTGGMIGLIVMHEQTHVAIYRGYGIEAEVDYFSYFPDVATIPTHPCPTENCILAHNINEIVAYPLLVFYVVIGFGLLILIILKEENNEKY